MSMKEAIHEWIDRLPDDSAGLCELYEKARLDQAIREARKSIAEGHSFTLEEVKEKMEQKWAKRRSA